MKEQIYGNFKFLDQDDLEKIEHSVKQINNFANTLRKLDNRSRFEKFYDSVSNFLFGGKSFFTKNPNKL